MSRFVSRLWPLAVAFLLGSSLPLLVTRAALAADETPDLVVEAVKAEGQIAELKVTNKSQNWANETTMIVQAQGQLQVGSQLTPNLQVQTFPIENLDPGQSTTVTYVLPIPCFQHTLIVNVVPAGNYEDAKETNQENNTITVPLCVSTASADPGVDRRIDYGGCGGCGDKPKSALGLNAYPTDTYTISATSKPGLFTGTSVVGTTPADAGVRRELGWTQNDGDWGVFSLGIHFSPDIFKGNVIDKINTATITYKESPIRWTSGSGKPQDKDGCVTRLFNSTDITVHSGPGVTQISPVIPRLRSIDVKDFIAAEVARPNPRYTFVLKGSMDSVEGNDNTSCYSQIDEIFLNVNFTPK